MDYRQTAAAIIAAVGGAENVEHFEHCSTRLRFTLHQQAKADVATLKTIEGVIGVQQNYQTQVIIGNEVIEVYEEAKQLLRKQPHPSDDGEKQEKKAQKKWGAFFLDFIISIFQPLIPAIAGGGILQSLLLLCSVLGWMQKSDPTYQVLTLVGSAPLYFLPVLVAITTANKLKVNALVAVSAVGALLLPGMTTLMSSGTSLLTLHVQNITYSSQVFPAILTVLFYALMEGVWTKITPKSIRVFFVPMISLLLTVPMALLLLGPLGYNVGLVFSGIIIYLFGHFGWVATALLASVLPFMVATGMHKAMIPYAVSSLSQLKAEPLYLPASLAHNLAEAGACFAVSVRTKDQRLRSTAISAGISALFGITEPALYGVTILHKKVLYSVMGASLLGGAFAGIVAIKSFALVGPGLASITMFIDEKNPQNILWALVTVVIAFFLAFASVLVFYREEGTSVAAEESQDEQAQAQKIAVRQGEKETVFAPIMGEMAPIEAAPDDVFSSGMVGPGWCFTPEADLLVAPVAGTVQATFATGHAIGIKSQQEAEWLLHIGVDTVNLNGEGFELLVEKNQFVPQGTPLIRFDRAKIAAAKLPNQVMMVLTNHSQIILEEATTSGSDSVTTATEIGLTAWKERG